MNEMNRYKMVIVATVERAIEDYLANNKKAKKKYVITREELVSFLHRIYSDEDKINAIMKRVDYLYKNGVTKLGGETDEY